MVLKMRNNGVGGCGNDLAIDDIMFRSCGDFITIGTTATTGNTYSFCKDVAPININLQVNSPGITTNVLQWQESLDNVIWNDIIGENTNNYATPNITTTQYYRVKVAQDVANLNNPFCSTISEVFSIIVNPNRRHQQVMAINQFVKTTQFLHYQLLHWVLKVSIGILPQLVGLYYKAILWLSCRQMLGFTMQNPTH